MSCYYYLRCRSCDVELEHGYNHGGDELFELVSHHRTTLGNYARILRDPKLWPFSTSERNCLEEIAAFMLDHWQHELVVVDEYARERD